jgi:hypothetical protein
MIASLPLLIHSPSDMCTCVWLSPSAAPLKPALGEHWRMQPHCRISLMAHQSGDRAMEATLMKSTLEVSCLRSLPFSFFK